MATKIVSNQIVPGGSILEETSVNHSKGLQYKKKKKKNHIISDQKQQKPNWIPPWKMNFKLCFKPTDC